MKKLILIFLSLLIYSQSNGQIFMGSRNALRQVSQDSLILVGNSLVLGNRLYFGNNAGFRFFNNQLQFSNDLLNWYNIPTSLTQGGGWIKGTNKIYKATVSDQVFITKYSNDTLRMGDIVVSGVFNNDSMLFTSSLITNGIIGYYFDGIDDYTIYNADSVSNSSVLMYVYPLLNNRRIMSIGAGRDILINSNNEVAVGTLFTNPKIYVNGVETNKVQLNKWNCIVVTYDSIKSPYIILGTGGGSYFNGYFAFMRLYGKRLNAEEIRDVYNNGLPHLYKVNPSHNVVISYEPQNAGASGWLELISNRHASTVGNPICYSSLRDYRGNISTTTVQLVNSQKANTFIKTIIVKNNSSWTGTFRLGITTNANEIVNDETLGANETKIINLSLAPNSLTTSDRSLFCRTNGININLTIMYEEVIIR